MAVITVLKVLCFVADAQQRNMRKQKLPKYLRDLDMIGANVCLQKLFDMKF